MPGLTPETAAKHTRYSYRKRRRWAKRNMQQLRCERTVLRETLGSYSNARPKISWPLFPVCVKLQYQTCLFFISVRLKSNPYLFQLHSLPVNNFAIEQEQVGGKTERTVFLKGRTLSNLLQKSKDEAKLEVCVRITEFGLWETGPCSSIPIFSTRDKHHGCAIWTYDKRVLSSLLHCHETEQTC